MSNENAASNAPTVAEQAARFDGFFKKKVAAAEAGAITEVDRFEAQLRRRPLVVAAYVFGAVVIAAGAFIAIGAIIAR